MEDMDTDLLKHFHLQQRAELNYRRSRLYQIFTWTLAILLAILALLVRLPDTAISNPVLPVLGSIFVFGLALFSTRWQSNQQKDAAESAEVIARIVDQLGAFESGLYPKDWKDTWGVRPRSHNRQLMTWLLALITVATLWVEFLGSVLS